MKRHIAPRRLNYGCDCCGRAIVKGDIYYTKRTVWKYEGEITGWTNRKCAQCKYYADQSKLRFERFKPNCHHPLVHEVWSGIPGEYVMQPDHEECLICGEWV